MRKLLGSKKAFVYTVREEYTEIENRDPKWMAKSLRLQHSEPTFIITSAANGNLRWFADGLIEKAFIARDTANGILETTGKTPADKAGTLLNSVFTKIETSEEKRRWFDEFIAILSTDVTNAELVKKLRTHVGSGKYSV